MRDMNPRSACRRTPTLMEIHMTTYKPTGEKPDEFNLYLQERMAALGLDPKTIAENTGIALPTVLTHLNLPGKPIKPQSIQKFAAELNVPYAVLRDLYTRVRCQGKVRTKYVIGMMPKGETALLAMMIKNTLTTQCNMLCVVRVFSNVTIIYLYARIGFSPSANRSFFA